MEITEFNLDTGINYTRSDLSRNSVRNFERRVDRFPHTNNSATQKFIIFIRDVPSFEHVPMLDILLTVLHDKKIFPNFTYSVSELLKVPENIVKMKNYGVKRPSAQAVTNGCSLLMKDLIDYALRSNPELVVVDYISESLVDVRRIADNALQKHYKVLFLKRKPEDNPNETIERVVKRISSKIQKQNLTKIRRDQEIDKYWNESIGITVKHIPPVRYFHQRKSAITENNSVENQTEREQISWSLNDNIVASKTKDLALCFVDQTKRYCSKMNGLLNYGECLTEYLKLMKELREDEFFKRRWSQRVSTLVIVKEEPVRDTRRLIDTFVEKLADVEITNHVVPVGEMTFNQSCLETIDKFVSKFGWQFLEAFRTIVRDIFYQLYDGESVIVLDCIHESLVGTEMYINDALQKNWKVYILNRSKVLTEEEVLRNMVNIVRLKRAPLLTF